MAYQEAFFEGIEHQKREMVLKMHADNLPIETISKYSDLDIQEVKNIIDLNENRDIVS